MARFLILLLGMLTTRADKLDVASHAPGDRPERPERMVRHALVWS